MENPSEQVNVCSYWLLLVEEVVGHERDSIVDVWWKIFLGFFDHPCLVLDYETEVVEFSREKYADLPVSTTDLWYCQLMQRKQHIEVRFLNM